MPTLARWRSTWTGLGVTPPADEVHAGLIARYEEPHRRYHTVQHLDECFARLDDARALAEHIHEVELALWFHDAVYDTRRSDNEAQSAALARAEGVSAGLSESVLARVDSLILATRHDASPATAGRDAPGRRRSRDSRCAGRSLRRIRAAGPGRVCLGPGTDLPSQAA